jgi:hypothetical protein
MRPTFEAVNSGIKLNMCFRELNNTPSFKRTEQVTVNTIMFNQ